MQPKFCSKCGNPLKEGDKFCRKCGTPIKNVSAPAQSSASQTRPAANIPSYREVEERFNNVNSNKQNEVAYNPEGTVLLAGPSTTSGRESTLKHAQITLSLEEMLSGCSKVVDFGTGKRYEILIPSGLSPGDKILVKNTGITDPDVGGQCDIELTAMIG